MQKQSNSYTLIFTAGVTIVLGFLLSVAATSLKERQELNVAMDIKKNILRSLDFRETEVNPWTTKNVKKLFENNIIGLVVDGKGNPVEGMNPDDLSSDAGSNLLSVFCRKRPEKDIEGYAVPISGKGLWSTLYGYIALEADGKTVKGITFYKHGETPGLGGEIEKKWFTDNYKGKQIVDLNGALVSIQAVKGQVDETSPHSYHQVDGISGATMTTKGLNDFLFTELEKYEPYFRRIRAVGR